MLNRNDRLRLYRVASGGFHQRTFVGLALIVIVLVATFGVVLWRTGSALVSHNAPASFPSLPAFPRSLPGSLGRLEQLGLPANTPVEFEAWRKVEDFPQEIAQLKPVFWEPDDTTHLRRMIRETDLVKDKRILEIGTGTGLVALCCLTYGAQHVVATDINPSAVANAVYNAEVLEVSDRLDVRLVSKDNPSAYSVIREEEMFDLIISNPPWEDFKPQIIDDYALFDEDFVLLRSILKDLRRHLAPGGRALLAYGCLEAIHQIQRLAPRYNLETQVLGDEKLDALPEVFLPAVVLEVRPRGE